MRFVERLAKTCPKCHSHLMIREGENGDFLACPRFPACRYTEPLPEGAYGKSGHDWLTLELRPENNYCKECNHTGLLPFVKDGRTISHAYIDCGCRIKILEQEYDRFQEIRLEDFDYPMSDTFRGFSYQYCGVTDTVGSLEPIKAESPKVTPQKIIVKHHYISPGTLKKKVSKYD